eukprot:CAMPEP_0183743082 /NCGR_PEP_ID=MMETSP0737-20130205/65033_1 /TAXON_ID=385413 /ORGANISM="Thalassiosira miniscula, Strain CCMP1093" /LENGTH=274 /DNA_ID=CAMNT_0025978687 /DNA_START=338 /DNA_END=1163 /DNA_ORIENTATION=-
MKLLTAATTLSLVYGAAASCSDYDNEVKLMDKLLTAATTLSLVYGAAASCSDYDNEVKLMDQTGADSGGTFHYTLGDEDIMGCVHNPEEGGWTAIGFSSNGKMLAEDGPTHNAIIGGFVETGPMKFDLTSKAFDGSGVTPSASQTLTNASYELSDSDVGGMVLKFTKKLEEEGEVPIKTNGENKIIFSWGQPMNFHTVYSHVKVNFMAAQDPPEPETNDEVESEPETIDEVDPVPETNDEVDTEPEVDPMDSGAVNNVLAAGTAAMAFVTAAML